MVPSEFVTAVSTPTRRVFLAGGMAGFGLWLVSGDLPTIFAAATPPVLDLDLPLWRSLAFTAQVGGGSIQLATGTTDSGPLVYSVDALGARALARIPAADRMSIAERVTGAAVFGQLAAAGLVEKSEGQRVRFQEFLTAAITAGILLADTHTQKVVTRMDGANP